MSTKLLTLKLCLVFLVFSYLLIAQEHYYSFEKQIALQRKGNEFLMKYIGKIGAIEKENIIEFVTSIRNIDENTLYTEIPENKLKQIRGKLKGDRNFIKMYRMYKDQSGMDIGIGNEICVKFKTEITTAQKEKLLSRYTIYHNKNANFYNLLTVDADLTLEIANFLAESDLVEFSHPNFLRKVIRNTPDDPEDPPGEEITVPVPTDVFFNKQFYLHNTGQQINYGYTGTVDADIDAPEAWQITKGNSTVRIAIIDDGVVLNHTDLVNRLVVLNGCNFVPDENANNPSPTVNPITGEASAHGTAIAGIIAANHGNEGIAGITPSCMIMPIKVPFGYYEDDIYANAIDFARLNNASVISSSWGYDGVLSNDPDLSPVIKSAILNAVNVGRGGKGCVVVFAAGNNANNSNSYNGFAHFPSCVNIGSVFTVGASTKTDIQADYSPTDNKIDIVAPSSYYMKSFWLRADEEIYHDVWATDYPGDPGYNPDKNGQFNGDELPSSGSNFKSYTAHFGGTSAAAPQVAAVAALVLSINPTLTAGQVFSKITQAADMVGPFSYTNHWNNRFGYGRLNAYNALKSSFTTTISGGSSNSGTPKSVALPATFASTDYIILKKNGTGSSRTYYKLSNNVTLGAGTLLLEKNVQLLNDGYTLTLTPSGKYVLEEGANSTITGGCFSNCPPAAPTNFSTAMSGLNVVLNWSIPSDPTITGFYIFRNGVYINTVGATTSSYTDINAGSVLPASYVVKSVNPNGSSSTSSITVIGSNTLSSNTNLSGVVSLYGTVSVNPGVTLSIAPGTILYVAPAGNINCSGNLQAIGTQEDNILFTPLGSSINPGSWGSIILSGSSAASSVISYVNVNYGGGVQFLNNANAVIKNSKINTCTQGVYFYNSAPTITYNTIYNPQQNGIYGNAPAYSPEIIANKIERNTTTNYSGINISSGGESFVGQNDISGFDYGIYCGGGVGLISSTSTYESLFPNNRIKICNRGLVVGWGSYAYIDHAAYFGNNSIYGNTYTDVYVYQGSEVLSNDNWWGGGNPTYSIDGTSSFYLGYVIPNDPWDGYEMQVLDRNKFVRNVLNIEPSPNRLKAGFEMLRKREYGAAFLHYKSMLENNQYQKVAINSMLGLRKFVETRDQARDFVESYLESKNSNPIMLRLFFGILMQQENYQKSLALCDRLISEFSNTMESIDARFQKFFYTIHILKDYELARNQLNLLNSLYENSDDPKVKNDLAMAQFVISNNTLDNSLGRSENFTEKFKNQITTYPNPFNPTTTIRYILHKDGIATLKVYDILGKEVVNLVNEFKQKGTYSVTFNASTLASGIYFYRFQTQNILETGKLMLIK